MLILSLDEISEEFNIPKYIITTTDISEFVVRTKEQEGTNKNNLIKSKARIYYLFCPELVKIVCENYLKRTKRYDEYDFLNDRYRKIQVKGDKYFEDRKRKTNKIIKNLYKPVLQEQIDKQLARETWRENKSNPKLKAGRFWTQSAIDCLNKKGFCSVCELKQIMSTRCKMKYVVKSLLTSKGKPKDCKITDREIITSFLSLSTDN